MFLRNPKLLQLVANLVIDSGDRLVGRGTNQRHAHVGEFPPDHKCSIWFPEIRSDTFLLLKNTFLTKRILFDRKRMLFILQKNTFSTVQPISVVGRMGEPEQPELFSYTQFTVMSYTGSLTVDSYAHSHVTLNVSPQTEKKRKKTRTESVQSHWEHAHTGTTIRSISDAHDRHRLTSVIPSARRGVPPQERSSMTYI